MIFMDSFEFLETNKPHFLLRPQFKMADSFKASVRCKVNAQNNIAP